MKEFVESEIDQRQKSLKSNLENTKISHFEKYQDMFVGKKSVWELIKYEVLISWLSLLPGALGILVRNKLFKFVFNKVGQGVLFGKDLTIRCPGNIMLGDKVIIDDKVVLDAKGMRPAASITIKNDVLIGRNTILSCSDASLEIKEGTTIGPNCYFASRSVLTIGCHVGIGSGSQLLAGGYALNDGDVPIMKQERVSKGIIIEDDVFIGAAAIVQDGVTIGRGSVIGSGAVVRDNIPEYSVAVGIPAKVIRSRK